MAAKFTRELEELLEAAAHAPNQPQWWKDKILEGAKAGEAAGLDTFETFPTLKTHRGAGGGSICTPAGTATGRSSPKMAGTSPSDSARA